MREDSINCEIFSADASKKLADVSIDRDGVVRVYGEASGEREALQKKLDSMFRDGAWVLSHTHETLSDGNRAHTWIQNTVSSGDDAFFPAAIAMIEEAGYIVKIKQDPDRVAIINEIRESLQKIGAPSEYIQRFEKQLAAATTQQLHKIREAAREEL